MSPTEIVQKFFNAIEAKNFQEVEKFLSDDFSIIGPIPKPVDKQDFLAVHKALSEAIPDLKFNVSDLRETEYKVHAKVHITGRNSGKFSLPSWGIHDMASTGNTISLPNQDIEVIVNNDKIQSINVEHLATSGVMGMLKQLGFDASFLTGF